MQPEAAIEFILSKLANELPAHLYYHGHHHTIDVLEATSRIAEDQGIVGEELSLLLVATAYHDCGFLFGHRDHELRGCEIARDHLPKFGFSSTQIELICEMIMATKVPQNPTGTLADILCDADLDYLGRDDFEPVANSLFQELKQLGIVTDIEKWNRIQLSFLSEHHYHTSYSRRVRQPAKQVHLEKVRQIVASYDK